LVSLICRYSNIKGNRMIKVKTLTGKETKGMGMASKIV
jgi:hypothetical protein